MNEIESRYYQAKPILGSEFNTEEGLEFFGTRVWDEHEADLVTAQEHLFDSDTTWQRVRELPPDPTPEQIHLRRNCEHTIGGSKIV